MKKLACVAAAALMITALSACSGRQLQALTVGVLPDVDSIPLIIADNNCYFKDGNLNVRIESFKSAVERDAALQTGRIDGAVSDILAAAFAKEGGFDVRITSGTDGSYKLLVGKDSGITDISGLKGKSVAISKNTIIEYATDRMIGTAGLSGEDLDKQAIPQIPTRLEMLQNGKIDAATLPEPLASVAVKNGAILLNSSDKLGINPGVILFTAKAANDKSNEIKAFYKAYDKAVDYLASEDKSNYIDVLIEKAGFPPEVKDTIKLPSYKKASLPSEDDFNGVISWLCDNKLIKQSYSFNDLVDGDFAR